jgi:hypothetical protein
MIRAIILLLCACTTIAFADSSRFVTMQVNTQNSYVPTNEVTLSDFETAEVVSFPFSANDTVSLSFIKDDQENRVRTDYSTGYASYWSPIIVAGPAKFRLSIIPGYGNWTKAFCTLKITPASFPPNKTLVVEPNQGTVAISLESSTNLLNWATATNGIYGTTNEARFFRIRMDKLN